MTCVHDDATRACGVVLSLLRNSENNSILGKTKLQAAFYLAHLFYAKIHGGCLSDWLFVRMPHGPAIDDFDRLLAPLLDSGAVAVDEEAVGPYTATRFTATSEGDDVAALPEDALPAIRATVEFIESKSGARLNSIIREHSHSWRESQNWGEAIDIYADLLTREEYERRPRSVKRTIRKAVRESARRVKADASSDASPGEWMKLTETSPGYQFWNHEDEDVYSAQDGDPLR